MTWYDIFLHSQRHISLSSWRQTKWCLWIHFGLWPYLSSAIFLAKWPISLTSSRERNSQKRRNQFIFLLLAAMFQTTSTIVARAMTITQPTNVITLTANTTITTTIITATITIIATKRPSRKAFWEKWWLQILSLLKKGRGCAQWTFLLFKHGHLVQKKESLFVEISFLLLLLFLLLLEQQQKEPCNSSCCKWLSQTKQFLKAWVLVLGWWGQWGQ